MDYTQSNVLSMTGGTDFATVADLTNYVDLTTNQTITSGVKTFTALPESSAVPTTGNQLTNKTYVDGLSSVYVTLATTQTITGAKTINANLRLNNTRQLIFGTTTLVFSRKHFDVFYHQPYQQQIVFTNAVLDKIGGSKNATKA